MKAIILGAGATAFCDIANPARRPPLATAEDFQRMARDPIDYSVWTSPAGAPIGRVLDTAIEFYEGDLELLFADLFDVQLERSIQDPDSIARVNVLRRRLAESKAFPFTDTLRAQWLLSLTSGGLRFELAACLGTTGSRPAATGFFTPSRYHRELAERLEDGDAVISFNYDLLMPLALLAAGCLRRESFDNHYLVDVRFPDDAPTAKTIDLITPRGSFAWFSHVHRPWLTAVVLGRNDEEMLSLMPTEFGMMDRTILPLKAKRTLIDLFPVYGVELVRACDAVANSSEVHLIGKQFVTADADVAALVAERCSERTRHIVYANPCVSDAACVVLDRIAASASQVATWWYADR